MDAADPEFLLAGIDFLPGAEEDPLLNLYGLGELMDQGIADLLPVPQAAIGVFKGQNRSHVHMLHIRGCKKLKKERNDSESQGAQYGRLKRAWDDEHLRVGDFAASLQTGKYSERQASAGLVKRKRLRTQRDDPAAARHPNQWSRVGVLRVAFRNVGRCTIQRDGVHGTRNCLEVISGVAQAAYSAEVLKLKAHVEAGASGECHVVNRYYDATPMRLSFHQPELRERLLPLAKFFIKDGERWRAVSYTEYSRNNRLTIKFGVLEVFAQEASIASTYGDRLICQRQLLVPPKILKHGTGSCIHAALDGVEQFSLEDIKALCGRAQAVFLNDCPDDASSNRRRKRFCARQLRGVPNVCLNLAACYGHHLHRVIVAATDEKKIAGDVHAIAYTCSRIPHQNKLHTSLRMLVDRMTIVRTPPDASLYNQHRELLANTLCRRMVGAIDVDSGEEMFGDAVFALPSDDRKRVAVETLLRYCNGDWRLDTIHHHCVPGVCDCRSDAEVVIHFHMS